MNDSLLNTGDTPATEGVQDTSATETQATEAPAWGSEDWQLSKYESVEDQAKAYNDLQSRFGGFVGAPEDGYTFELPEGSNVTFDAESAMTTEFNEFAKSVNMDQATYNQVLGFHARHLEEVMGEMVPDREAELAALGHDAERRIGVINDYAKANLNDDEMAALEEATTTAAGVALIEKLILKSGAEAQFGNNPNNEKVAAMSRADVEEMMQDPRYYETGTIGEAYRAKVAAAWQKVFPHG